MRVVQRPEEEASKSDPVAGVARLVL
jgi:hypothetical protein